MLTENDGVMLSPQTWGDYEEDSFSQPIKKYGNVISVVDDDFGTEFETKYEIGI